MRIEQSEWVGFLTFKELWETVHADVPKAIPAYRNIQTRVIERDTLRSLFRNTEGGLYIDVPEDEPGLVWQYTFQVVPPRVQLEGYIYPVPQYMAVYRWYVNLTTKRVYGVTSMEEAR